MNLNTQLFFTLYGLAHHSLAFDTVIIFFAQYLAYIVLACAVIFLVYFFIYDKDWKGKRWIRWGIEAVVIGVSVFCAWFVSFLIKISMSVARPFVAFPQVHALITETKYDSFPSGHATFFFALATAIYLYDRRAGAFFFICAILISIARVMAGVHFPLDILVGALIGTVIGCVVHMFLSRDEKRVK